MDNGVDDIVDANVVGGDGSGKWGMVINDTTQGGANDIVATRGNVGGI